MFEGLFNPEVAELKRQVREARRECINASCCCTEASLEHKSRTTIEDLSTKYDEKKAILKGFEAQLASIPRETLSSKLRRMLSMH